MTTQKLGAELAMNSSDYPLIRTLADIEMMEAVPWRDRCSFVSTYEAIKSAAEEYAQLDALTFLPSGAADDVPFTVSYRELLARITQTANLFHSLGVGASDVVSYILPNFPETHEVIWGGEAAGIVNAINPLLEPMTIKKLLSAANAKVIVTIPPLPTINLWDPVVALADELDHVEAIIFVDPAVYFNFPPLSLPARTPGGKPILRFQDARESQDSERLSSNRVFYPSDIASLFHTGGTTGVPKLAPHTHENEVFMSWCTSQITPLAAGERALIGLPLFHVNAVIGTGLASFLSGANQVMPSPMGFRGAGVLENLWKILERFKASYMSGVPTIYSSLMSVPKDGLDLGSLKFAAVGAASISPDLFKRFEEYSGVELVECYGLTESTVLASANPMAGEKRVGSVGLRMPYQEMRCAEIDADGEISRFSEAGEVGTIVIRGPNVFPGYYKKHESGLTSDGWLNTGDLGRQDEDGYFWLTGRSKDLIIRGGHNIDPGVIENTLEEHEAVAMVAAIGQPDEYAGELPIAYVQLRPGAEIDPEDLRIWAKARIPERAAAPVYLEVLETLPVTAVGKIFKPPLRTMAVERVLTNKLSVAGESATVTVSSHATRGIVATVQTNRVAATQDLLKGFALSIDYIGI